MPKTTALRSGLPIFPPEIVDTIIEEIDRPVTLRACSLVCRSWVPASRHKAYSSICIFDGGDLAKFLELVSSPTNTFGDVLKTLKVRHCYSDLSTLLSRLPYLESLVLEESSISEGLTLDPTCMPGIKSLEFSYTFFSLPVFYEFLSLFPTLKSLTLGEGIHFTKECTGVGLAGPHLDLDSLAITIELSTQWLTWLSAGAAPPRPRTLELKIYELDAPITARISEYLRLLNVDLKHLRISSYKRFDHLLDFSTNTALQSITISGPIEVVHHSPEHENVYRWDIFVSPDLPQLLRRFNTPDLEELILKNSVHTTSGRVTSYVAPHGSASMVELGEALELPSYARMKRLRFESPGSREAADVIEAQIVDKLPDSAAPAAQFILTTEW
ncbi:hypothetical protein GGX14DRAFT_409875 [Mycena pura]|uniref:F-box domain-containing protein n=1 Tax=Mycena pura TaxID=153505 RepID=A0AAD6YUD8_9AGAR|nr:hypothetical protein GGX14DRAFT_409875 [Mycena pura]